MTGHTDRNAVVARLKRAGWVERHGGNHDVFKAAGRRGLTRSAFLASAAREKIEREG